jgi:hypothetical protein
MFEHTAPEAAEGIPKFETQRGIGLHIWRNWV